MTAVPQGFGGLGHDGDTVLGEPLAPGEQRLAVREHDYRSERQILWLFGLMLLPVGIGAVLIYFALTIRRRMLPAAAVTSQRLLVWPGPQRIALADVSRIQPLPAAGIDWIAALASGQRGRVHTDDRTWLRARGLLVTLRSGTRVPVRLPYDEAEQLGPAALEAWAKLRNPETNRMRTLEDDLVRPYCKDNVLVAGQDATLRAARGRHGETLLHRSVREDNVCTLLGLGLDPNGLDERGRTPLAYTKTAGANRALLRAGADVRRTDALGKTALELQANPPDDLLCIGYVAPDFAALDVLLVAGAEPPTRAQVAAWVEDTGKMVTAAGEASDHTAYARWLESIAVPEP